LNGLLDITKRKLSGHSPAYFCTNCTGIQYDPDAPEPKRWHQFLSELWPDDPEARQTLVEIFGYLLTYSTDQQKIFLLVGPRRSGKGTIARLLSALLGQENVASPTLTDLNNEFGLAPLVDKKVAIVSDARIGGREVHKITERLLSISGQDRKSVNRKFKDQWEEQFHVRFFVCSNELPNLADASAALPSRYVPLIIKNSFYDKEDHELISKLLREMPAILNEALQGLDRLLKRGHFLLPKSSKDALRQMEDLASPVKAFARDWCIIDADRQVETVKLYKAFVAWCDDNGHKKVNRSLFGRDLHAAYPKISRMQGRTKGARKRFYSYIDLSRVGEVQYQDFLLEKRRT
jgi:putative DNA primase/helicase